jgi:hypothetical protein
MNKHSLLSTASKIVTLAIFVLFGMVSTVSADFSQKEWRAYKEIRILGEIGTSILTQLPLDAEVLATSTVNLRDLRVVGIDNKEVPSLLVTRRDTTESSALYPQILNKGSVVGESTSFVADFGKTTLHNQITLNIDNELKNYRKKVQIYGSVDMSKWQLLADNQIIYDYSKDYPARNTTVSYPESTYRYVLVKIIDTESAPVQVLGASARRDVYTSGSRLSFTPSFEVTVVGKNTEIITDFGQQGILSDRAVIFTDSKNFERSVNMYSSADKKTWSYVGGDVIYRYKTRELSGDKANIVYSESNVRYLKLVVHNQDNQPLEITDVKFSGYAREITFLAEPSGVYRLFYGNEKAIFPSYDFAQIYRNFRGEGYVTGALGAEKINAEFVPPVIPLTERKPWLLGMMLGIVAMLLGLVIFRVVKKTAGVQETQ